MSNEKKEINVTSVSLLAISAILTFLLKIFTHKDLNVSLKKEKVNMTLEHKF